MRHSNYSMHQSDLMGRQIILKWSYLIIFMRVLVAVSVRGGGKYLYCKRM